jgi:hypothetical protein
MAFSRNAAVGLLVIVTAALPATAQIDGGEDVRVYTNADLERLAPLPVDSEPVAADPDPGWQIVTEFLDREHARLDAERAHDLERRRVELEERTIDPRRSRAAYAYPFRYPYGVHPYGRPGKRHGGRGRFGSVPRATTTSSVGGRIVPLHARPTLAQTQRAKAIRRSGTDAFPSRGRP